MPCGHPGCKKKGKRLGFNLERPLPGGTFERKWFCTGDHREAAGFFASTMVQHQLEGKIVCEHMGCTNRFLTRAAMKHHGATKHGGSNAAEAGQTDLSKISGDWSSTVTSCVKHLAEAASREARPAHVTNCVDKTKCRYQDTVAAEHVHVSPVAVAAEEVHAVSSCLALLCACDIR